MKPYDLLLEKIHLGKSPYAGFPMHEWAKAWYGDHGAMRKIFDDCFNIVRPNIIVEVGSFVGESAIHMAKIVKARGLDTAILCIDTWYAGVDHWKGAPEKIQMHFGRPDLYYKFIANVMAHGCQDVILPLAFDSINGARLLKWMGIVPNLVYCDASHEEGDVGRDYDSYWDLLPSGGGMLIDDYTNWFPGVLADTQKFMAKYNIEPTLEEGEKMLFIKP